MCGRYDLNAIELDLAARFGVALVEPLRDVGNVSMGLTPRVNVTAASTNFGWRPRYNIAPGQHNPVVVRDANGNNQIELMQWGLVPAWSREAKLAYSTINARAETLASKPTFRKPLASQRCLVPATGYFEWVQSAPGAPVMPGASPNPDSRESQGKQPYRIQ